ncbi:MAG: PIN domain-containing protein [Spirochaetaceae bacterium]|jgi:predicted nucleic acid-binding protein|nr:PIN domain-containing protein [Spirochaetaceae bacterium]
MPGTKAYIDTNIILDFLLQRKPFYEDAKLLVAGARDENYEAIVGTYAITDIHYWLTKETKQSRESLNTIFDLLEIISLQDTVISDMKIAYNSTMLDFEDAVASAIAQRENADYIITRNTIDFVNSPVPAILPSDFITLLKE